MYVAAAAEEWAVAVEEDERGACRGPAAVRTGVVCVCEWGGHVCGPQGTCVGGRRYAGQAPSG